MPALDFPVKNGYYCSVMASNVPGKHFHNGLSLPEIFQMFPDGAAAEKWVTEIRWPDEIACVRCGSERVQTKTTHPRMPFRCRDCRKFFSPKTGTPMQNSNLGYQAWAIATYLMTTGLKGAASMKLHRDLNITQKSAWHMAMRIRESWERQQPPFDGQVEVDESFFGCNKEKNKHKDTKLRQGRGAVGKTAVVGVKDRKTGKEAASATSSTGESTLRGFVQTTAVDGAKVYSDESAAYKELPNHESCSYSVGKWVDGQAHTNGLELFWSLMKRGYHDTYHKMSPWHLDRYAGEFESPPQRPRQRH